MTDEQIRVLIQEVANATAEAVAPVVASAAAKAALEEYQHTCVLGLKPDQLAEVNHTFDVILDIGCGNLSIGLEEIRDNHTWVSQMRRTSSKIMERIGFVVVSLVVAGLLGLVWLGFKRHILPGS